MRKVNIDVDLASDNSEQCLVRMVASPAAAKKTLSGRHHYCGQPVLALPAHNRTGELEQIAPRFAKAGVNINGSNSNGEPFTLVLSVNDPKRVSLAVRG